jgi:hypothetical protein
MDEKHHRRSAILLSQLAVGEIDSAFVGTFVQLIPSACSVGGGLIFAPSGEPSLAPAAREMNGAARAKARTPALGK